MSTTYDVYCRDCSESLGLEEEHSVDTALALVRSAPKLALIGRIMPELQLEGSHKQIYLVLDSDLHPLSSEWFNIHVAHDLVVQDEYGRFHDECNQRIRCDILGDYHRCRLSLNHAGSHSGKRP